MKFHCWDRDEGCTTVSDIEADDAETAAEDYAAKYHADADRARYQTIVVEDGADERVFHVEAEPSVTFHATEVR